MNASQDFAGLEPRSYAEYWINTILFPAGYGTTVFARQGMGKTNLGVFSMQTGILLHPNWVFLHTIPFPEVVKEKMGDKFVEVRSAREMMLKVIESVREGKVPAFVADEFDSVFSSRSFSSRPAKSWLAFTWRQRHFSLRGPLMLYHDVKTIPPPIRNKELGGEILWIKGWEEERYLSNPDLKYYMRIGWSRIPYLSHGNTGFEIDVDFAKLLNKVSGSQEEVMDQIEEKLMREEPDEVRCQSASRRRQGWFSPCLAWRRLWCHSLLEIIWYLSSIQHMTWVQG